VLAKLDINHRLESRPSRRVDRAAGHQDLGEQLALRPGPGAECRDELVLVDKADLQGEQPEKQVARRLGGGRHGNLIPSIKWPRRADFVSAPISK
jgi:hypothetical protein